MNRFYWIGSNQEGKSVVTMTIDNRPPKEMVINGVKELNIPDDIYKNFIPITKEEALKRCGVK
jgi:hypothetical protein